MSNTETAPKLPPKPSREQARVLYPYEAQNEDELTINEGDIINVLSKEIEDQGWFKGELNGKVGVFPDNFVELIKISSDADDPKPPPPRPAHVKGSVSKVSSVDGGSVSKLNGAGIKADSSKPPTILTKILGGGGGSGSKKSTTTTSGLPNVVSNSSISTGRGSPLNVSPKVLLSSSPKGKTGGPPDVVPHSDTTNVPPSSNLNRSVSSAEENETITDLDTTSGTKLLTNPSRPKGPNNRRPPSYIAIVKDESGLENGSDNNRTIGNNNHDQNSNNKSNNNNDNKAGIKGSPTTGTAKGVPLSKVGSKDDPDNQPPAPWMIELRKTQELKRGNSKDVPATSSASGTPTEPIASSTIPSSTTIPGIVPRPLSTSTNVPRGGTVTNASHRASGDFTSRMQALLKKDGSFDKSLESEKDHPIVSNTSSTGVVNVSSPISNTTASNVSPSIVSKPNKPSNKPGGGLSPITSSITSLTTSNPTMNTISTVTGSKPTPPSSHVTDHTHNLTMSSSSSTITNSPIIGRSNHNKIDTTDCESIKITEGIQKEMKLLKESMVPRNEFDDLMKQVNEMKESFETYKRTKKQEMKELINEVAEERTKVATLQIEVDRLRKLSTTV